MAESPARSSFAAVTSAMAFATATHAGGLTNSGMLDICALTRVAERDADDRDGPIPMILNCPCCGGRHVDEGEFATREHHTHACQHCGVVWRPAIVATVGVQFLPGFKDA